MSGVNYYQSAFNSQKEKLNLLAEMRFPSALQMSLGLRPRDISLASGNLSGLGKSLCRRGCSTQYTLPLGSVRIQYESPEKKAAMEAASKTLHSCDWSSMYTT